MTRTLPRWWFAVVLALSLVVIANAGDEPAPIEENGVLNQVEGGATAAAASAKDLFDLLDGNHDGSMDRKEFTRAVDQFEQFLRHNPNVERTSWFARPAVGSVVRKDLGFWNGFTSAVGLIVATEIGDKTFFIAAVLSMKNDRRAIFGGAILALIAMTVLSTLMGLILPQFLDRKYTHIMAGVLFWYFGLRLLYESTQMQAHKVSEELEEVEEELLHGHNKKLADEGGNSFNEVDDNNDDSSRAFDSENQMRNRGSGPKSPPPAAPAQKQPKKRVKRPKKQAFHMLVLQSFTLTFLAEWGDRSQIATIALAAAKNPYGVTIGGCIGHSLCTGMAVLGGRMLAARISEKTVSQYGGALFLFFGFHSLFFES